jgi:hypothetical protein
VRVPESWLAWRNYIYFGCIVNGLICRAAWPADRPAPYSVHGDRFHEEGVKLDRRSLGLLAALAALGVLVTVAVLFSGGAPLPGASAAPTLSPSPPATNAPLVSPTVPPTPAGSLTGRSASPSQGATPAVTPRPEPTIEVADVAGTWSGTWSNVFPDTEAGALEITLIQFGSELEGTVTFDGNGCLTTLPIQGALVGDQITLNVLSRDEVELEGELSGSTMSGSLSMTCNNAAGSWTVRRDD